MLIFLIIAVFCAPLVATLLQVAVAAVTFPIVLAFHAVRGAMRSGSARDLRVRLT